VAAPRVNIVKASEWADAIVEAIAQDISGHSGISVLEWASGEGRSNIKERWRELAIKVLTGKP
jgi:hypothetical protein